MPNLNYRPVALVFPVIIISIFTILLISKNYSPPQETQKSQENQKNSQNLDISVQQKYLSDQIKSLGPQKAYLKFKEENQNKPANFQHPLAHIFGQLLYQQMGIEGITVCDSSFSFGCYHALFTSAIADKGESIITDLNSACTDKFGPLGVGCHHGLGHGILEYLGPNKLNQALKICASIQKLSLLGCSSGVFMEYNFPTIIDGDKTTFTSRQFDSNNPFSPCESVENRFKPSCYFEITQWWQSSLQSDYKKIGLMCDQIKDTKQREGCFIGVGYNIPPQISYNLDKSVGGCDRMPGKREKTLCLAGVSWSFFSTDKKAQAKDVCQFLDKDDQSLCMEKADLIRNTFD